MRNSPTGTWSLRNFMTKSLSSPTYRPPKTKVSHNECRGKKETFEDAADSKHKRGKRRFQLEPQKHSHLLEGRVRWKTT